MNPFQKSILLFGTILSKSSGWLYLIAMFLVIGITAMYEHGWIANLGFSGLMSYGISALLGTLILLVMAVNVVGLSMGNGFKGVGISIIVAMAVYLGRFYVADDIAYTYAAQANEALQNASKSFRYSPEHYLRPYILVNVVGIAVEIVFLSAVHNMAKNYRNEKTV